MISVDVPDELYEKLEKEKENWIKQSLYITFTRAKVEYFLTDKLFRSIGDPDLIKPNPNYRSAPTMKLYLKERLENWIADNSDLVEKIMLRRHKLSKIQKEAHQRKRERLLTKIKAWEPQVYLEEISSLILSEAYVYYTNRYADFNGDLTDNAVCSYIRHWYTDYEGFLSRIDNYKGQTGVKLIYPIIKKRVNDLISEKFDLQISESSD